ncbi:MAG TPA: hypothetical protein VLU38_01375 [Methanomassiliicoccales archaeon]|nr:hypothetical protein [Methanomassiliicoccales archaeon]
MRIDAKGLLLVATLTTLAFALISDPTPPAAEGFADASDAQGPVNIVCQVTMVQARANGTTLTLVDADQAQAKAFMPNALGKPPRVGQIVSLTLTASDTPGFYFVEAIAIPSLPTAQSKMA